VLAARRDDEAMAALRADPRGYVERFIGELPEEVKVGFGEEFSYRVCLYVWNPEGYQEYRCIYVR
jgi:hypothetical protein